jgi:hypothetical protein
MEEKEKQNVEVFDRYDLLCEDLKHQLQYISDIYQFDFDHMNGTISEMIELQKKVRI